MKAQALAFSWVLLSVVGRVWAVEPLTSLPAVRALTPEEGGQRLPVRLDAVATFYPDLANWETKMPIFEVLWRWRP